MEGTACTVATSPSLGATRAVVHVYRQITWNPRTILSMSGLIGVACAAVNYCHVAISGASFTQSLQLVYAAYKSEVEAVRLSASSTSTMRHTVRRASMSSCHGTARLLTPPASTMCNAMVRAALS